MCAGWPIFTLPISPSGMKPRRYTLERSSSVTIAVPACTTSPGSAARVSTVPENGASTVKSARSASACASCACAWAVSAFAAAIVDCCSAICPCGAGHLRAANFRIVQVCLRGGQRAAGRFHSALRGGYRGSLLVGLHLGLESLLFGSGAGLRKPRVGVAVEFGEPQRGLLLREVRLRGRQVRLRLPNAAIRIRRRLARLQLILAQLILQHGDLIARGLRFCLRVDERGPRLIFARAHLRVVEPRDHLARRYGVAFADGDLENFPARLSAPLRNRRLQCVR